MASPIHSFLFSPPPSPPADGEAQESAPYSSLRSLLPRDVRNSFDYAANKSLKASPKLGETSLLPSLSAPSRSAAPSRVSAKASRLGLKALDIEAANLPTIRPRLRLSPLISPRLIRASIPRPILRMLVFVACVLSGVMLLRTVTDVVLPGMPQVEVMDAQYGYVPPQAIRSRPLVSAPPRTQRPVHHPLPPSHELLALQSFIVESAYHHLLSNVDPTEPLDASDLLGNSARRLGETGSAREQQWLEEVAEENAHNVVLWYASNSVPHYVMEGVTSRHGQGNRPTLVSTAGRSDAHVLRGIFARLGFDLDVAPLLVIGGEPIHATGDAMAELRSSGKLAAKLGNIGWRV